MRYLLALILATVGGQGSIGNQIFDLKDKKSSYVLLESGYPSKDFDLDVIVRCIVAGRVLDTVGIDAAPVGSWCLEIGANRLVVFHLYDGEKWSNLVSKNGVTFGRDSRIHLIRKGGILTLSIDGVNQGSQELATPLSGAKVFVGDYKGDERFGADYDIYQAMAGTVRVTYFGELRGSAAPKSASAVLTPGGSFVYFQPESKLYMTAIFGSETVRAHCATRDGKAPRDFEGPLKPGSSADPIVYGSATFQGGGGGDVFYQFDTAGKHATTLWRPINGPTKWFAWIRVAKVGDTRSPDFDSLDGGSK